MAVTGAHGCENPAETPSPAAHPEHREEEILPRMSEESLRDPVDLHRDAEKGGPASSRHSFSEPGPDDTSDVVPADGAPSRSMSRASSARSRPLSIVPKSKRRGLFARLTIIPELSIPQEYANKTKWYITAVVAIAGGVGPLGSSIFYRMSAPILILALAQGSRGTDHL